MLRGFLTRGCAEGFKGSVHALTCGLAGLMFAYNTAAWLVRRERHLAVNGLVYGCSVLYEARLAFRHLKTARPDEIPKPARSQRADPLDTTATPSGVRGPLLRFHF